MNRKIYTLLLFLLLLSSDIFSQDTIRYDDKMIYKSTENPYRGKLFVSKLKYVREDIVFSKNERRVEYCYYYDDERNCYGNTYKLLNDSVLVVNNSEWNYIKKSENGFSIWRKDGILTEYGNAKSLFPLEKEGVFYTVSNLTKDTLWQEDYNNFRPDNPWSKPLFSYYNTMIEGKIYEYDEIHIPPTNKDYTSFDKIKIIPTHCISGPTIHITLMTGIITKEGKIVNIEQALGNLQRSCPYTLQEIITKIAGWGTVFPATKKGKPVNVRWFITVDNKERMSLHPVYADTPQNRAKVIKRMKKKQ